MYKLILSLSLVISQVSFSKEERSTENTQNSSSPISFKNLLPKNKQDVEILGYQAANEQLEKIYIKIQKAIQKNPEWYKEHLKNQTPGKPMSYHKNFGITKEEYKFFNDNTHFIMN